MDTKRVRRGSRTELKVSDFYNEKHVAKGPHKHSVKVYWLVQEVVKILCRLLVWAYQKTILSCSHFPLKKGVIIYGRIAMSCITVSEDMLDKTLGKSSNFVWEETLLKVRVSAL